MRGLMWLLTGAVVLALLVAAAGVVFLKSRTHGFSAREQPTAVEAYAAGLARDLALPAGAKDKQNPIPASDEVLAEARAHWADHCASCHANDGSGQVPMGQQMYPPAPDMRKESTQKKTDGELFYVIENGIRLSGMPAWGTSQGSASHVSHGQQDSWKLVHFIRRLPSLSPAEISEMEALNPKSPDDLLEEKQEEEFLKGGPSDAAPPEHHHH
jgi:mono/diheme cytochrome c family protein